MCLAEIVAVGRSSSRRCADNLNSSSSMAQVHYDMYTRTLVGIMSLPPTDLNLFVHVHFQMLLWKAADYLGPLYVSFSEYGLEIKDWIIWPSINKANCSCHRVKLPHQLLILLNRRWVPKFSNQERGRARDVEQHNYDYGHNMITMNRAREKMTRWMIAI